LSQWCQPHARDVGYYGAPGARLIRKREYKDHKRLVRKLLRSLGAHPALVAAEDVMKDILTRGSEPKVRKPLRDARWLLWREKSRLTDVTPREGLEEVLAVWIFSYFQRRVLPDDNRLTCMIAQAVMRLRQLEVTNSYWNDEEQRVENGYRLPPALAVHLLGKTVRRALAPFAANVIALIEQQDRQQAERAMALSAPLT
jgi:hypothetical protein